ncbi:MAG: hypothetical protein Q8M94_17120, partial [Ignavibacteria bacterium]|nr:hypothetical protein [Ignavibacteria bacterium]
GKANKLKRIRRIKEAKLKREQELLADSGLNPASVELRKRAEKAGLIVRNNQSKIKYSELLKYFVLPFIGEEDDFNIVRTIHAMGAAAWNAAIMKEKSEENYLRVKKGLDSVIPKIPEIELMFEEMVQRKQDEFAEYKNIIVDFEIKKISGTDYHLSVGTTQI